MRAELDLMGAVLQKNQIEANLRAIDDRGNLRKKYAALLDEFEALLAGADSFRATENTLKKNWV